MIVDVVLTLARRWRAGAHLGTAHREHFYQRATLPAWGVAGVHWSMAVLGGLAWHLGTPTALALLVGAHAAWLCFVQGGHAFGRAGHDVRNRSGSC